MTPWRHRLEALVVKAWYRGAWWLYLLWPLSVLVGWVVSKRRQGAEQAPGLLRPVVVVGGITIGGTGKTPVVIALTQRLGELGFRVGIVSRGYGGSSGGAVQRVEVGSRAAVVGDEPLLMARRTGVPVFVGHDRLAAAQQLIAMTDVNLVLSDDGLQHYRLPRDYEIAVIDAHRGLGNGHLLPMGPLREPATRLDSVNWVLQRNGTDGNRGFSYRLSGFDCRQSGARLAPGDAVTHWQGLTIAAVTGLGQPEQFFDSLERLGLVITRQAYPDHYSFTAADIAQVDAEIIVVTEKDAVKLEAVDDQRIWVLSICVDLPEPLVRDLTERLADLGGVSCSTS